MESISFDRVADRYDVTRGGEERGTRLAADLAPLLDRSRPVLEIGVGTGIIARPLRDLGFKVLGLDISPKMLAKARERLGPRLVNGDAGELPIGTASVDQSLSVWVLHLVGDVGRVMAEVARVLRPGGRYLVMDGRTVDDDPDPFVEVWRELDDALGRPRFTDRIPAWAAVAPGAGLRVAAIEPTGPYPVTTSAAQIAANLERRTHSWMWSIPEDVWQRVVLPVVARLRARSDADETVSYHAYQQVLVLESIDGTRRG